MWLREMRDGAWSREKLGLTGEKPLSSVNRSFFGDGDLENDR